MAEPEDLFAQPAFGAGEEGDFEDEYDEEDESDEGEEPGDYSDAEPGNYSDAEPGDDGVDVGNAAAGGAALAVLAHVATSLVDDEDSVRIEVAEGRSGLKLSLHVAPPDMGRVIGRRGRTAQAIRTLVRAAAASEGTDASVDIVD